MISSLYQIIRLFLNTLLHFIWIVLTEQLSFTPYFFLLFLQFDEDTLTQMFKRLKLLNKKVKEFPGQLHSALQSIQNNSALLDQAIAQSEEFTKTFVQRKVGTAVEELQVELASLRLTLDSQVLSQIAIESKSRKEFEQKMVTQIVPRSVRNLKDDLVG